MPGKKISLVIFTLAVAMILGATAASAQQYKTYTVTVLTGTTPSTVVIPRSVSWSLRVVLNVTNAPLQSTSRAWMKIRSLTPEASTAIDFPYFRFPITASSAVQFWSHSTTVGSTMFNAGLTEKQIMDALQQYRIKLAYNSGCFGCVPTILSSQLSINFTTTVYASPSQRVLGGNDAAAACFPHRVATVYTNSEWLGLRQAATAAIADIPSGGTSFWLGGKRSTTNSANKFCWNTSFGYVDNIPCTGSTCSMPDPEKSLAFCSGSCYLASTGACSDMSQIPNPLNSTENTNPMSLYLDSNRIGASMLLVYRRVMCESPNATIIFGISNEVTGETRTRTATPSRSLSDSREFFTYQLRITNDTGVLQLRRIESGAGAVWKNACGPGWSTDGPTGLAMCKLIGFEPTPSFSQLFRTNNAASPLQLLDMAALNCTQGLNTIALSNKYCQWSEPGNTSCTHANDNAVNCRSEPANFIFRQQRDGALLVRSNWSMAEGYICSGATPSTMPSYTRQMLCNLAGGEGLVAASSTAYKASRPTAGLMSTMSQLSCSNGGAPMLTATSFGPAAIAGACSWLQSSPRVNRDSCSTGGALAINCLTPSGSWRFNLTENASSVALEPESTGVRLLRVRHNSTAAWGVACGFLTTPALGNRTALFFCRNAGIAGTARAYLANATVDVSSSSTSSSTASAMILLDQIVSCPWSATSWSSCGTYMQSSPELPRYTTCNATGLTAEGGATVTGVVCIVDTTVWQFQMNVTNGLVMARENSGEEWGTICSRDRASPSTAMSVSGTSGRILCELLGWPGTVTSADRTGIQGYGKIATDSVDCTGTFTAGAPFSQLCTFNNESFCSHSGNDDLSLNCHISGTTGWVMNQSALSGIVLLQPQFSFAASDWASPTAWGTACLLTAAVSQRLDVGLMMCRYLGWSGADAWNANVRTVKQLPASLQNDTMAPLRGLKSNIFFSDIICTAGSTSPAGCTFVESANGTAFQRSDYTCPDGHDNDLAVDCFRPPANWGFAAATYSGALEASYVKAVGGQTVRGTVCAETALMADAMLVPHSAPALTVCRLLGWQAPVEARITTRAVAQTSAWASAPLAADELATAGTRPILLSNISGCNPMLGGNAPNISACTSYLESIPFVSRTVCTHAEDAVVEVCHAARTGWSARQFKNSSLVQVRPPTTAPLTTPYGTICNGSVAASAQPLAFAPRLESLSSAELLAAKSVVCRMLGWTWAPVHQATTLEYAYLNSTNLVNNDTKVAASAPVYISNMTCSSGATGLQGCEYQESSVSQDRSGCYFTDATYGSSAPRLSGPRLMADCRTDPALFQFRYDLATFRLETRPNMTAQWGTVCVSPGAPMMSNATALAICRKLAGDPYTQEAYARRATASGPFVSDSVPVYLQDIGYCHPNASSLADCSPTYIQSDFAPADRTTCRGHEDDVVITCIRSRTQEITGTRSLMPSESDSSSASESATSSLSWSSSSSTSASSSMSLSTSFTDSQSTSSSLSKTQTLMPSETNSVSESTSESASASSSKSLTATTTSSHTASQTRSLSQSITQLLTESMTHTIGSRSTTASENLTVSISLSKEEPYIIAAASQLQAGIAMGASAFATLLFREPTPPLTASRALSIAAMARACRDKTYVSTPRYHPLLFPQQSLMPFVTFFSDDDSAVFWWRQYYRGAIVAGMFIVPFGWGFIAICMSLIYHLLRPVCKRMRDRAAAAKSAPAARTAETAANEGTFDAELEELLRDVDTLQTRIQIQPVSTNNFNNNNNNNSMANLSGAGCRGDDEDGDGGGGGGIPGGVVSGNGSDGGEPAADAGQSQLRKFWASVWLTSRAPTIVAIALAIALENVAACCVLLLALDSQGFPYSKALDFGLAATALIVFGLLLIVGAVKTRDAVNTCDCVDSELVRGEPPEAWPSSFFGRLLFGSRCWALSRETELNRPSHIPAFRLLKPHLIFVGPFHGRNLMRPTEGSLRFRLTTWTFDAEMLLTAVFGLGRGMLMAQKVKCISAAIWSMVLIGLSVIWCWTLRPRISPLMAGVDFFTFGVLLAAAVSWIINWRYSDDVAGFGAIVVALGTLTLGGATWAYKKMYSVRSVPKLRADDIDVDDELAKLLDASPTEERDIFERGAMDSALLAPGESGGNAADNNLELIVDMISFENLDDPHFSNLYIEYRDLVADGAAKNIKAIRELRSKMRERAIELGGGGGGAGVSGIGTPEMRQQLALQRVQRRAELIASGRDPETGRTFESLMDPNRPFEFTDDPECRRLVDDYRRVAGEAAPYLVDEDSNALEMQTKQKQHQARLDAMSIEIEKRQEVLALLSDDAKQRLVKAEAKRNAERFRQYLPSNPYERAFTCSDDPEFGALQREALALLRTNPRDKASARRLDELNEKMLHRATELKQMQCVNRQMLADAARAERARQIAEGIDPETGKTFDVLTNPNRPFEYTDDAVYKALHDEYKALSENPIAHTAQLGALAQQMQLRSKVLDKLSPEEKAALVRQTAARNAARLQKLFDWNGGDPLGPKNVFLLSDDADNYGKLINQTNANIRENPSTCVEDCNMLQLDMRLRADELKLLGAGRKQELIDARRKNRLDMIMNGIDPVTGLRFSALVDDKRAFECDDDPGYRALHDEYDFLSRDNPIANEARLAELQRAMANRCLKLQRSLTDAEKTARVKETAQRNGERIRRMMNTVFGDGSGEAAAVGADKFLLTDDTEYAALQRQMLELLGSGRRGAAADAELAALQQKLQTRALHVNTLSAADKKAMMMLRQQNNRRMYVEGGRDPFTGYSLAQLADKGRGFCVWDDVNFDAMARELKLLLDSDPNSDRAAELAARMQRRGAAMQNFSAAEKQERTTRTANAFQSMLQALLDGTDPLGPKMFVTNDDLVMRKAAEETHDLARRGDLFAPGSGWHSDMLAALSCQQERFPQTHSKLSDAEKARLVRARREEAARFAAAGRDMRSGLTYDDLTDIARDFEYTDDSVYEQLFEEMQHLNSEHAARHAPRIAELDQMMAARAGEIDKKMSAEQKRKLVQGRAARNLQQFAHLNSRVDPLGAAHFIFTDDPAYRKIHDDIQQVLRRPMSGNNERLEAMRNSLLQRANELSSEAGMVALDAAARQRLTDARRAETLRKLKNGIEPITGKPYSALCDSKRTFQYTDDGAYRRALETYNFLSSSNPRQHERRLADLAAFLKRRQGIVEKWDDATKRRAVEREIERLQNTRRRALNYGIEWTPEPDASLGADFDLEAVLAELGEIDIENELEDLPPVIPKPQQQQQQQAPTYSLDDDDDGKPFALDDSDDDDEVDENGKRLGAARNEELMRRQEELRRMMDEGAAAAEEGGAEYLSPGEVVNI